MQVNLVTSEDRKDRSFHVVNLFSKWLFEKGIEHKIYKNSEKIPNRDTNLVFNIYVSHDSWCYEIPRINKSPNYTYRIVSDDQFIALCRLYDTPLLDYFAEAGLGLRKEFSEMTGVMYTYIFSWLVI
jgi:hypothetical protein